MTNADIWQIVIGILSMISSFGLTLFIFIRQVVMERKIKIQETENKVTAFIIENKEEIALLPLCIISNNLNKTDIHKTKIYTNFNKCSAEIQTAILQHEDIKNFQIAQEELDKFIKEFTLVIGKYDMGKNMFYDGAKYFYRGYVRYQNEKIENINPYEFDNPVPSFLKDVPMDLFGYVNSFLEYKINPSKSTLNDIRRAYFKAPLDLLYNRYDFGNGDEKILCFWLMRFVISTCYVLCNNELVKPVSDQQMPYLEEFNLKTYEDLYYYSIYMLRKTFLNEIEN